MAEIHDLNAHRAAAPTKEASITRNQQILAEIQARWAARTPEEILAAEIKGTEEEIGGSAAAIRTPAGGQGASPIARQHRGEPGRAATDGARARAGTRAVAVIATVRIDSHAGMRHALGR